MISDVENELLETVIDSGNLTLVESIAYYNLYLNNQFDRMIVSSGGESPGPWSIGVVFGRLAYDRFMVKFGGEMNVPKTVVAPSEVSMKDWIEALTQVYPEYPHERIGRLIDFAAKRIMLLYNDFISELDIIQNGGQSRRMNLDFFIEYVERNSLDDNTAPIRMDCIDFTNACCHALKVLTDVHLDIAE